MRSAAASALAASRPAIRKKNWQRRRTRVSSGLLAEIEFHLGGVFRTGFGGEVGLFLEAHDPGEEHRRHAPDRGVVVARQVVEPAALDTDAVLGALELRLQLLEICG